MASGKEKRPREWEQFLKTEHENAQNCNLLPPPYHLHFAWHFSCRHFSSYKSSPRAPPSVFNCTYPHRMCLHLWKSRWKRRQKYSRVKWDQIWTLQLATLSHRACSSPRPGTTGRSPSCFRGLVRFSFTLGLTMHEAVIHTSEPEV